jgi:hypothetical protein
VAGAVTPEVGCASVGQATAVIIRQTSRLPKAIPKFSSGTIYRQVDQVRALFGQVCAAVTHPAATMLMHCPVDLGTSYLGTFLDGARTLGTFTFALTGCARVSFTAAGKTMATMVYGQAAAAAPHLLADLNVLVGTPTSGSAMTP